MGSCVSSSSRKKLSMSIYIPSWNNLHNIGGVIRTTAIFDVPLFIGEHGFRWRENKQLMECDIITGREKKHMLKISQGVSDYEIVQSPSDFVVNENTTFVFMETLEFWNAKKINPTPIYDIDIRCDVNYVFVFGNERDGLSDDVINTLVETSSIPAYITQRTGLKNIRKRHSNVSLNLAHAVVSTIGIMRGREMHIQ